jgi:metal-dependent amidase/aminoacylase/carboxypeptidase family protein
VIALQTIVSRNTDPLDTAVITIGEIHGGTVSNVIPEAVTMTLSGLLRRKACLPLRLLGRWFPCDQQ